LPSHYNLLLTRSVLHSCPSLFKYIFIVQRVFTMVFQLWIYCTLVSLTSSITLPYHSPILPITHSFQCILLCLLPTQKQYISYYLLYIILFSHVFLHLSHSLSEVAGSYLCWKYTWEANLIIFPWEFFLASQFLSKTSSWFLFTILKFNFDLFPLFINFTSYQAPFILIFEFFICPFTSILFNISVGPYYSKSRQQQ
jgi:hypothetical protein